MLTLASACEWSSGRTSGAGTVWRKPIGQPKDAVCEVSPTHLPRRRGGAKQAMNMAVAAAHLAAIVQDEHLSMLERRHCPGIRVEVGVCIEAAERRERHTAGKGWQRRAAVRYRSLRGPGSGARAAALSAHSVTSYKKNARCCAAPEAARWKPRLFRTAHARTDLDRRDAEAAIFKENSDA